MSRRRTWMLTSALLALGAVGCKKDDGSSGGGSDELVSPQAPGGGSPVHKRPEDGVPPPALTLLATTGGSALGTMSLSLAYPADISDYDHIDLRRADGATAPADCDSGTLAATVTDFAETQVIDTGLYPGAEYSYTACAYDATGNVTAQAAPISSHAGTDQRVFVTSVDTFNGNLAADYEGQSFDDGLSGADARCTALAAAAGLPNSWRAILSGWPAPSAVIRVPIYGRVLDLSAAGNVVASDRYDFWNDDLKSAIGYDENGAEVIDTPWTGAYSRGTSPSTNTYVCSNWTSDASDEVGLYGIAGTTSSAWLATFSTLTCDDTARLFCLEVATASEAPTIAAEAADADGTATVSITFPADMAGYGYVKVLRQKGVVSKNDNCETGFPHSDATVKVYDGGAEAPFADETFDDEISTEGYFNYQACVFDVHDNLIHVARSESIQVGTDFLRAFVTSTTHDGSFGNVAAANTICTTRKTAAGLSGTWKAAVAGGGNGVSSNLSITKNVFDLEGNYVVGSGELSAGETGWLAIATDENGDAVSTDTKVWTGAYYYGGEATDCSDWSSNSAMATGYYGKTGAYTSGYWLGGNSQACNTASRIYCIEQ